MNDSFGAAFGRLVKRKRAESKMTQAQLARALYPNLAPEEAEKRKGDISNLETGKVANPAPQTVKRLADALDISDDDLDALQKRAQLSPGEQLENLSVLGRDQLELLASRFEIDRAFAKSDEELAGILQDKAKDYRAYKEQVAALPEHVPEVMRIKAEAKKAADALEFEKVEELLAIADIMDTAAAAQTKLTRAGNALLMNRTEQAFEILSSVADSFRSADPTAPIKLRAQLYRILYDHGLRYGGSGLALAERMLEEAADALPDNAPAELANIVLLRLSVARGTLAPRLSGPDAARKMGQAVEAMRDLARRLPADDPKWATTQQNLGNALAEQGIRTAGPDGAALLAGAVAAFRDALTVFTRDDHPVDWARTQFNLALAEVARADYDATPDPRPHLEAALTHVEAALTEYDEEHMSRDHDQAQRLRDDIRARLAAP